MQPLRLGFRNFCGHQETEFSFEDFQSALIIGKVKDNERFSNGAGKSTIFNAIEYVLFNEIHFSSLEKIIRDGCDVCKVEYDFISSLDKCVYRIVRANSRRTGTDVRLFKQTENNEWEDLTQRRVSDTEKEIVKIVGFNYKAFCASVLFSQAGSENNVQRDFGNLPALTPEKRKSVLREVLQLNVYGNYEKLAKSKYGAVQSLLEKQKIILSTLGDPESFIKSLSERDKELESVIVKDNLELALTVKKISELNAEYTVLNEKVNESKSKISSCKGKLASAVEQVTKSEKTLEDLANKRNKLLEEANQISKEKVSLEKEETLDVNALNAQLAEYDSQIIEIRTKIRSQKNLIQELESPISEGEICKSCHQNISEEHRHSWAVNAENQKVQLYADNVKLLKEENVLLAAKTETSDRLKKYTNTRARIDKLESELQQKRSFYSNYSHLIEEHSSILKSKKIEQISLQEELEALTASNVDTTIYVKIDALKNDIDALKVVETNLSKKVSQLIGEKAVIKHKIESANLDKTKIASIKTEIEELEKSLILHSKVVQAFGSNGIPALITHSILDELQEEANKWLLKLRPGLQLQFVVVNDKNNKEKEDTLDILYFIDGNQREYKQLSGAQKIIVSLAIKLALLFIMNKRIGVDIKLMLLDEVDQALDPGSTEVFADIIKIIQDEIKIMVITHDDDLKHKFSHAIMVEQDENNVSKGKLINW
jgi:exonuclease SbcC